MATLKEPVKIFIIQSLACRDTPQEVADLVKQEFDLILDRSQVALYDPTKRRGKNLSKKYVQLFEKTREDFDAGLIDIPIANKFYRLKEIQKMYDDSGKNKVAKQKLLKLAHQETDGRTIRQEHTGKDGADLEIKVIREFID
ncbi:DUF2280 domain-containing protein [Acinetobacter sp. ANC 5579]|uniref:DUF2280 domain-containing protein n=1 Tax=Acinetobacter TaxID=469 RepID=UPI001443AB4F|nr:MULTISPECIES: DUF2280 domain-containing protein [Acinetobacter]MCL6234039.1 DUF2280 domain-containing protein [Acinetobacter amyesii]MCL6236960.1 DUF2280 domain-containing protein [Acinetobacter amyesii]